MVPVKASALGMLLADLRVDKVWTQAFRSSRVDAPLVASQFASIREAAEAELREEGFSGTPEVGYAISMRYAGQNYEHLVPIAAGSLTEATLQEAFRSFERIHEERYGYAIAGEEIELVAFHVTLTGRRPSPRLVAPLGETLPGATHARRVHFRGMGAVDAAVFRRYDLPAGARLEGPAVIEEAGSTTLVEPGMICEVLPDGQLLIETGIG
jgi:N-methylhydantoinase A